MAHIDGNRKLFHWLSAGAMRSNTAHAHWHDVIYACSKDVSSFCCAAEEARGPDEARRRSASTYDSPGLGNECAGVWSAANPSIRDRPAGKVGQGFAVLHWQLMF